MHYRLVLADGGEYDGTAINRHRNTGIALALISLYFWYLMSKDYYGKRTNYIHILYSSVYWLPAITALRLLTDQGSCSVVALSRLT